MSEIACCTDQGSVFNVEGSGLEDGGGLLLPVEELFESN